ncbi:MAG: helix-turn-helix domain-containing protein [Natronomonas sp.]
MTTDSGWESDDRHKQRSDRSVGDPEVVLTALEDSDCRDLLTAIAESAGTVPELARRCEIPKSTAYRKVELLEEASLVAERIRLRSDGRHAGEYHCRFEGLTVSFSSDGFEISVSSQPGVGEATLACDD